MKKEYVVTEISIAPDGSPYVSVSMVESKDFQKGQQQPSYPSSVGGVHVLGPISSPENISKDIQRALSGMFGGGMTGSQATVIKLDIREYDESGLKVGDKVTVEITRATKEEV